MMKKRKNLTGYLGENMLKRNILKSLLGNIVFNKKKQKGKLQKELCKNKKLVVNLIKYF